MGRGELGGSSHSERGIAVSFRTEGGTDLPLVADIFAKIDRAARARIGETGRRMPP
jgi:hypothetical protein